MISLCQKSRTAIEAYLLPLCRRWPAPALCICNIVLAIALPRSSIQRLRDDLTADLSTYLSSNIFAQMPGPLLSSPRMFKIEPMSSRSREILPRPSRQRNVSSRRRYREASLPLGYILVYVPKLRRYYGAVHRSRWRVPEMVSAPCRQILMIDLLSKEPRWDFLMVATVVWIRM